MENAAVSLLAAYRERARLLGEMLESAKEQLRSAAAPSEDDGAEERLDAATEKRQGEMDAVDRVNAAIALLRSRPVSPQDQASLEGLRADMNAVLIQIQALDHQTRAAIEARLTRYSSNMRASAQARRGIGAYMGVAQQIGSLYIDEQK